MHTVTRIVCQRGGLTQVLQPADAFLLFYRHPCWIDFLFQGVAALELLASPKLDGHQSQRQSFQRDRQAAVHENAAHGKMFKSSILSLAAGRPAQKSDL